MTLENKVALVTGSGRGIGKEIALTLARSGADVIVNDVNLENANETAEEIKALGRKTMVSVDDITDEESMKNLFGTIDETFGKIDILVNNAGITKDNGFLKMTMDQWKAVLNVNLTGTFICSQLAGARMKSQKSGKIINLASLTGQIGNFGQANYAASKGGIIAFTKTIARELARYGVNANAVAPGFISTPMTEAIPEKVVEKMIAGIPLQKAGLPSDVANIVRFLASEESQYLTGQVIACNGGLDM